MVGRIMAQKNSNAPNPLSCEYVALNGKKNVGEMILDLFMWVEEVLRVNSYEKSLAHSCWNLKW
jgi:hypothetical protein